VIRDVEEEFASFIDCLEERKNLLERIREIENDELDEFETTFDFIVGCHPYICFSSKEKVIENKDFLLTLFKLALQYTERSLERITKRLGIEKYEE
jgi:hypothetical protein